MAAVKVNGELARRRRQLMVEGDLGALAGGPADRRPGEGAVVGPHPRRVAGQRGDLGLAHRDLDLRVGDDTRDAQRRRELRRLRRPRWARRERASAGAPAALPPERPRYPPRAGSGAKGAGPARADQGLRTCLALDLDLPGHVRVHRTEVVQRLPGFGGDLLLEGLAFLLGNPGVALVLEACPRRSQPSSPASTGLTPIVTGLEVDLVPLDDGSADRGELLAAVLDVRRLRRDVLLADERERMRTDLRGIGRRS